jgi:hypothetical protein
MTAACAHAAASFGKVACAAVSGVSVSQLCRHAQVVLDAAAAAFFAELQGSATARARSKPVLHELLLTSHGPIPEHCGGQLAQHPLHA